MYFMATALWLMLATLATTAVVNLRRNSLLVVPTVLQCIVLTLMAYTLPIAIWGAILLRRRLSNAPSS